jgi:hypothetical protein
MLNGLHSARSTLMTFMDVEWVHPSESPVNRISWLGNEPPCSIKCGEFLR